MKIVVNRCFGGFSVTKEVYKELGVEWDGHGFLNNADFGVECAKYMEYRTNAILISAIEKLGVEDSSGVNAELEVVEIPDNVDWVIEDYDGSETISEVHQSW